MRAGFAIVVALAIASPARAEPSDTTRAIHLGSMVAFGGLYLAIEFPAKLHFASKECTWCDPPGFDRSIRDALRWERRLVASKASDVLAFAASPIALASLMIAASGEHRSLRRTFDDVSPMIESAIIVSLMQSTAKYVVRRSRPFVRFAPPGRLYYHDDNTAFWSGHTSAVFAETFACGIIAHERGYKLEPAIWATGITFGVVTGYLRLAADMHYASDVAVGVILGIGVGIAVPYLLHRSSLERDPDAVTLRSAPQFLSFGGQF